MIVNFPKTCAHCECLLGKGPAHQYGEVYLCDDCFDEAMDAEEEDE